MIDENFNKKEKLQNLRLGVLTFKLGLDLSEL